MTARPLHVLMTPVGSSGDVHPFVGLGRALARRGHEVTLIASEPFRRAAEGAGLAFVPLMGREEYEALAASPLLFDARRGLRFVMETTARELRRHYALIEAAHRPGRTVLVGHTLAFAARVFEELHGVPAATVHLAPSALRSLHRQTAFAPEQDGAWMPMWLRRAAWWAVDRLMIAPHLEPELNRWRAELGLPPVSRVFRAWLSSPRRVIGLWPEWFGPVQPDWPAALRLTGFPLFDEAGEHPAQPALEAFLAAGPPPVAFTPGSAHRNAQAFFSAALAAARAVGRRALLLTTHRDHLPMALPPDAHHEPYAPFSEVLPRCAALVHHGGVGTVAQALAAGTPQVVTPFAFDQPDNATRVHRLRAGTYARLEAGGADLACALRFVLESPDVARACADLRVQVDPVDALERTCRLVEDLGAELPELMVPSA